MISGKGWGEPTSLTLLGWTTSSNAHDRMH